MLNITYYFDYNESLLLLRFCSAVHIVSEVRLVYVHRVYSVDKVREEKHRRTHSYGFA